VRRGDYRPPLRLATEDRHRRVGAHFLIERIDIMHLDHSLDGEPSGDHAAQALPVLVAHPTVRADEAERPAGAQGVQANLEEPDVDVRASTHRGASTAVSLAARRRDRLKPYIRRIADHEVRRANLMVAQEKVVMHNPALGKRAGISGHPTVRGKTFLNHNPALLDVGRLQVTRADRVGRVGDLPPMKATRTRQPLDHRTEKSSRAARGLNRPQGGQIALAPIASQIEDQLNYPAPREHGAVLMPPVEDRGR
jgi:hypothetical protein